MNMIDDVLEEELSRLIDLKRHYEKKSKLLPKGSVYVKRNSGNPYVYLAYREGGRIKQRYLGREGHPKAAEICQLVLKRKESDGHIKSISKDIIRLRKMLHVR